MSLLDKKAHWENAWQARRPTEVSWHQEVPSVSLRMIRNAGLEPDGAFIDVGGGASVLVDHLLEAGYGDITVLDISAAALEKSRHRLGGMAKRIRWIESDITEYEPVRMYRLWHDRATFHFLVTAEDRAHYVDVMYRALAHGGQAVIAAFAPGGPKRCSGLDIVQYDAARLQSELGGGMVLREQELEVHQTPDGHEQKFGYYRFERVGRGKRNGIQSVSEKSGES